MVKSLDVCHKKKKKLLFICIFKGKKNPKNLSVQVIDIKQEVLCGLQLPLSETKQLSCYDKDKCYLQ